MVRENTTSDCPMERLKQETRRREGMQIFSKGTVRNMLAGVATGLILYLGFCVVTAGQEAEGQAVLSTLPAHAEQRDWNWADTPIDGVGASDFSQSRRICRRLRSLEPPATDWPDETATATLANCNSSALYYGINMPADPQRARQCALLEAEKTQDDADPFTGMGILMMVYANGRGAGRDLDLATSLACRIHAAPFAVDSRVNHLQRLKKEGWTGHDFDYCDDATSGMAGGFCAARDASMADAKRARRLRRLMRSWTRKERGAFRPLRQVAGDYATASGENEVDLSGSLRAAFVIEQEQKLKDSFAGLLERLERGWRPASSHARFDAADKELNKLYREIMNIRTKPDERVPYGAADSLPSTTVTKSGIRRAERAWLTYRDAWIAFARVRYPKASPDGLKAYLTWQRIDELRGLLPDAR